MSGAEPFRSKPVDFPEEFTPQPYDIIIGRGRKSFDHVGNQELRRTVASRLVQYLAATSQKDKTEVISSILEQLRDRNVHFVKLNPRSEKWFDVGDYAAREKISQTFRDALHEKYRSSTGYKKRKKQEKRRLSASSSKRLGSAAKDSHRRPVKFDGGDNQSLTHSNESSQMSSNGIIRSYMSILPSHLIEYENPFEPTPIDPFDSTKIKPLEHSPIYSIEPTPITEAPWKINMVTPGKEGHDRIELPCDSKEFDELFFENMPVGFCKEIDQFVFENMQAGFCKNQAYNISSNPKTTAAKNGISCSY